jgi:hypothetical protein
MGPFQGPDPGSNPGSSTNFANVPTRRMGYPGHCRALRRQRETVNTSSQIFCGPVAHLGERLVCTEEAARAKLARSTNFKGGFMTGTH